MRENFHFYNFSWVKSNKYGKTNENKMQNCKQICNNKFVRRGNRFYFSDFEHCHIKLKVVGWKPSVGYRVAFTVYTFQCIHTNAERKHRTIETSDF